MTTNSYETLLKLSNTESVADSFLLFDEKSQTVCFEKKTFFGRLWRWLTGDKAYNFERNIRQIEKLVESVNFDHSLSVEKRQQLGAFIEKLQSQIEHVVKKTKKVKELQNAVHIVRYPDYEELRKHYDTLSFVEKYREIQFQAKVMKADSYKGSKNRLWVAKQCLLFFQAEDAFTLFEKANQKKVSNECIELGLSLKEYDRLLKLTKNDAKIKERIERIQSFGDGEIENGFTKKEHEMLRFFSKTYRDLRGVAVLKERQDEIRDFMIYAAGNSAFNRRLKSYLDTSEAGINQSGSKTASEIDDSCDYFATFSFKADPKKWQEQVIFVEHMHLVWKLYEKKEAIKKALCQQNNLAGAESLLTLDQVIATKETKALQAFDGYDATLQKYVKAKRTGFSPHRGGMKEKKVHIDRFEAVDPEQYKEGVIAKAKKEKEAFEEKLPEQIRELQKEYKKIEHDLMQLQKTFSGILFQDARKLQVKELSKIDSLARFSLQLSNDMFKHAALDQNPLFSIQKQAVDKVSSSYNALQECIQASSHYNSGDITFINELKKRVVLGKKGDFVDQAALLLFPFGHMAFIDESEGELGLTHQRFSFDSSKIGLQELAFYDAYRIDFKKLLFDGAIDRYIEQLKASGDIEALATTSGKTVEEYALDRLSESYAACFEEVLSGMSRKESVDASLFDGIAIPDFTEIETLEKMKVWLEKVNRERSEKIEPFDLLEMPGIQDIYSDEMQERIQEVQREYLFELYSTISNDEKTQQKAFLTSLLYTFPLSFFMRLFHKPIALHEKPITGSMCCSQFLLLITYKALVRLDAELQSGMTKEPFLQIPEMSQTEYEASTTEFVLKSLKPYLKPVKPCDILHDVIDKPASFFQPIAIDSTISYIFKRIFSIYY